MRLVLGVLFWLALAVGAVIYYRNATVDAAGSSGQLTRFLFSPRHQIEVQFEEESLVGIGDPVVLNRGLDSSTIGHVVSLGSDIADDEPLAWTTSATVEFFSSAPQLQDGDWLTSHMTPDSMEWMVQMMLPPKTREEIGRLILAAYQQHHSEIAEIMQPIVIDSIRDAADVIRDEFQKSVAERDEQIQALANRYQVELVQQELVPLIKDEIWPIVQEETSPLAMEIGERIWQKASVWRFGWRFLYDRSPLPERNLVRQEFERFLERYGVPVLEDYLPEMIQLQQRLFQKISANPKVQEVFSGAARDVLLDPEFQTLATDILKDVFVDNLRLSAAFEKNWNSPQAKEALAITNRRLEPTITKIGQTLFGAPSTSITPEFSRVLRNRILFKDDRWLVLHLKPDRNSDLPIPEKLAVLPGETGTENPFHVPREQPK